MSENEYIGSSLDSFFAQEGLRMPFLASSQRGWLPEIGELVMHRVDLKGGIEIQLLPEITLPDCVVEVLAVIAYTDDHDLYKIKATLPQNRVCHFEDYSMFFRPLSPLEALAAQA